MPGGRYPWAMKAGGPLLGPKFSPLDISGLELWFDASDSGSITLIDVNEVDEWRDKSGNSRNLAPIAAGQRPSLIDDSGDPGVFFDVSAPADIMQNNTLSFPVGPSCSRFIAMRNVGTGNFQFVFDSNVAGGQAYMQTSNADAVNCAVAGATGGNSTVMSAVQGAVPFALIDRHENNIAANLLDNSGNENNGSTPTDLATPASSFNFSGTFTTGQPGSFVIYEFGNYSVRLNDEDRDSLMDYLIAKWPL